MITVYSKHGCPFCVKTVGLLESYGMDFNEVKIDEDDVAKDFVVGEGHRTVPQLYVKDTLLVEGGYDGLSKVPQALIEMRVAELLADYEASQK